LAPCRVARTEKQNALFGHSYLPEKQMKALSSLAVNSNLTTGNVCVNAFATPCYNAFGSKTVIHLASNARMAHIHFFIAFIHHSFN
jgi:hypothetical protein